MAGGDLICVEVTDRHGTAREFADPGIVRALRPKQRKQLEALAAGLIDDVAALVGYRDLARRVVLADVTRLVADEAAYERVAAQRGLLPL